MVSLPNSNKPSISSRLLPTYSPRTGSIESPSSSRHAGFAGFTGAGIGLWIRCGGDGLAFAHRPCQSPTVYPKYQLPMLAVMMSVQSVFMLSDALRVLLNGLDGPVYRAEFNLYGFAVVFRADFPQ